MKACRIGVTAVSIVVVQAIVCGLAIAPAVVIWNAAMQLARAESAPRLVLAAALLPLLYVLFALCLIPISALFTRVIGARTTPDVELPIADMSWALMRWAHYMAASHIVRLVSGSLFRGSPLWTIYLRLNGARIGRRVFVNTLSIADHNLLEFGDDVIVGADVHVSGHTVERGLLKTGRVRIGPGAVIGVGSIIGIDSVIGAHCEVGALTFIPKHARLDAEATYVGIPAHRANSRDHVRRQGCA